MTLPLVEGEGGALGLVHLRELVEAPGAQDFIQMPQGGHGRHQVNVQGLAVGVQLQNVLRREGGIIPPDFTEAVKEEGVFDVQV